MVVLSSSKTIFGLRSAFYAEVQCILFVVEILTMQHVWVFKLEIDSLLAISTLCKDHNFSSPLIRLFSDITHFSRLRGFFFLGTSEGLT